MQRVVDLSYNIALVAALCAVAFGLGLSSDITGLLRPLRNRRLLSRIVALDVLLIPVLVWLLTRLFAIPAGSATGLVLVGISSAGPLGILAVRVAGGNPQAGLSFVLVLEIANVIAIPAWAAVLLPSGVVLPVGQVIVALALLVVTPLVTGMIVRMTGGHTVERWARPLTALSSALGVVVIATVLARDGHYVVAAARNQVVTVAVITVLAALVLGWMIGGPERESRIAVALVTSTRANAVALAIAQASFPSDSAVRASVVTFGVCSTVLPLGSAFVLAARQKVLLPARRTRAQEARAIGGP